MDCRFCSIDPATLFGVPTRFGRADLCAECAARYAGDLRRRARPPTVNPRNEAGGPVTAARVTQPLLSERLFDDHDSTRPRG